MSTWIFRIIILGFLAVFFLLAFPRACQLGMQDDAITQIRDALRKQNLQTIEVDSDGELIHLHGEVPIAEFRQEAMEIARRYRGDRLIKADVTVKPALSPYPFKASLTPDRVQVNTYVASSVHRRQLRDSLQVFLDGRPHEINIAYAEGEPVYWHKAVLPAMKALLNLQEGSLEIAYRVVHLEGVAPTVDARESAHKALEPLRAMSYGVTGQVGVALSCLEKVQASAIANPLRFEQGGVSIKDSSRFLDELAVLSQACPETVFEVHGYTDSRGATKQNLALSQARAEAVVEAMLERGIPAGRFTAIGHGEASPIADNRTPAGRARNRRIEFSVKESAESDTQ